MSYSSQSGRRGPPGAKIKAPRNAKPQEALTETFNRLSRAIVEIQSKNASKLSFEEHYRYAYSLVLHKQGATLYEGVRKLVTDHLKREAAERIEPVIPGEASNAAGTSAAGADTTSQGQAGERFLAAVKAVWDDHTACLSKLRDVLKYMDKVYTISTVPPLLSTYSLGLSLFNLHIVEPVLQPLLKTLLAQIRLDRRGEAVNKSAIRACIEMLVGLGTESGSGTSVYKSKFEPVFLEETRDFYGEEARVLLEVDNVSAPQYLLKIDRRLEEEDNRTHHYLHSSTDMYLMTVLEQVLLTAHLDPILAGLPPLVEENRTDDLRRMYRLLNRVGAGPPRLRNGIRDWVTARGRALNVDPNEGAVVVEPSAKGKEKEQTAQQGATTALSWVQNVLDLKAQMDRLLADAFSGDKDMGRSINDAFEAFFKENQRSPEYISLFLDENLKKGLKGKTEAEVDAIIAATISLFRFLGEKDVFERYYKSHLARRLIQGRSISDDAERAVLAKLQIESGAMFVRDLEGMIRDMKLSSDAANEYRKKTANTESALDLAITVCTASHWPMPAIPQACILPLELQRSVDSFQAFYQSKHTGRKLLFRPDMGTVDVRIRFNDRKREVNVSTFGMVVLALFDRLSASESLSYDEIASGTQVPRDELKRTLQSLACAKYKILGKEPRSRDIGDADRFTFNSAFTCPLTKIKIQTVINRVESREERSETSQRVEEERKMLAESYIVRVMKDRKSMPHAELVSEVTRQLALRFQPKPIMVKLAIDRLIEKEYLARNETDRRRVDYLA